VIQLKLMVQNLKALSLHILVLLLKIALMLSDELFSVLVYFSSVSYLLNSKSFDLKDLFQILPSGSGPKLRLANSIYSNVRGIFLCAFKISAFHLLFSWIMLELFGVPYSYFLSFLAGLLALLPVMPAYLLSFPFAFCLYLSGGGLIKSVLFVQIYISFSGKVISSSYAEEIKVHPYITSVSVVLGIYEFGFFGVFYGPLVICLGKSLYDFLAAEGEEKELL